MKCWITYFLIVIISSFSIWGCSEINETVTDDGEIQLSITLVSQTTGARTNTINTSNPGVVRVVARDSSGNAMANELVTVATTKGDLSPEDGTAITDSNGLATISLLAGGDSGAGELTASISTTSVSLAFQIGTIVDSSTSSVGAIEFVSSNPEYIALKGTGGANRKETSIVTFRVVDEDGLPVPEQTVTFSLSTEKGGLSISTQSAVTDSSGQVQVVVAAGTIPTPVSVLAEVAEFGVNTISSELIVSTGLADQDSFSLSLSSLNPEALEYDGVQITATIHASDHFNNPIPDGTTVYFRTELGGGITPSCSTTDGTCQVTWTSGGSRPSDGLVTILAYVLGEESFTDVNGNGLFDAGDSLNEDLPEAWLDNDFDKIYDAGIEEPVDFNNNNVYDSANNMYNGTLCSDLAICTKNLVDVRDSLQIAMSGSSAIINVSPNPINLAGLQAISISVSDINSNSMPGGTTIALSTSNGSFVGDSSWTIPDRISPVSYTAYMKPDTTPSAGILSVKVTTPKGLITTEIVTVSD